MTDTPSRVSPSATETDGTFECPYCGRDTPHAHTPVEIDAMRVIEQSPLTAFVVARVLLRKVSENKGYVAWAEQQNWWAAVCGQLLEEITVLAKAQASADSLARSPSSPVPSSETTDCSHKHLTRVRTESGMMGRCMTCATIVELPSRGSEEELGKLLDNMELASANRAIVRLRGSTDEVLHEDIPVIAARSAVDSYVSRLRDERDRLKRFETYVCQVIAMGNQADLTVESLPR